MWSSLSICLQMLMESRIWGTGLPTSSGMTWFGWARRFPVLQVSSKDSEICWEKLCDFGLHTPRIRDVSCPRLMKHVEYHFNLWQFLSGIFRGFSLVYFEVNEKFGFVVLLATILFSRWTAMDMILGASLAQILGEEAMQFRFYVHLYFTSFLLCP